MKILVTGVKGQLGYDVLKELKKRNIECIGAGREQFDITQTNEVYHFIESYLPDAVIHCSAYTAVDKAEDEKELCYQVNVEGTKNIAMICKKINAKMLFVSTDYVFSGSGMQPHEIEEETDPLGVYGKTKLQGECIVKDILDHYFIVRTSWVYGKNGNNFVKTMLRIGKNQPEVNVVSDQIGSPTYTTDLASLICDMIQTQKYGLYHATNEGYCSWAEFAQEIFKQAGYSTKVNFISTEQYPTKAQRPKNSKLSKKSLEKADFSKLPLWQDAVKRYIKELYENAD